MRNGKAKGNSWITAEYLGQHQHQGMASAVTALFNHVAKEGLPPSWQVLHLTSIYKGSGAHSNPNHYRPIAIMPQLCKAYSMTLLSRLEVHVAER